MRFRKASVKILGTRPLWLHAFTLEALSSERQEKTGKAGYDPEEWRKKVLVAENNQLYLPPSYVFGCLRDGSKYVKEKRSSIMAKVGATLQVLGDTLLILNRFLPDNLDRMKTEGFTQDKTAPVYLDVRSVKNPSTGARNIRSRVACSSGWELAFEMVWDATIVSEAQMEAALRDAGELVGLGDGRSIGMGRFERVSWKVVKQENSNLA